MTEVLCEQEKCAHLMKREGRLSYCGTDQIELSAEDASVINAEPDEMTCLSFMDKEEFEAELL